MELVYILIAICVIFHSSIAQEDSSNASTLQSITSNQIESCNQRQSPGFICSTCSMLSRCVFRNNGWDTIGLELCPDGLFCNVNEGKCSNSPGPCNNPSIGGGLFSCTSAGVFPDPFSCQSYHMCYPNGLNLISFNVQCTGNTAFNPLTNDCSLSTNHETCVVPQYQCNTVGEMGAWASNPNIFYLCVASHINNVRSLFPTLYRCPTSEIFVNNTCISNGDNGDNGGIGGFNCVRPGLFPDIINCRFYIFCNGNLESQRIQCPVGTHFSAQSLSCVRGDC